MIITMNEKTPYTEKASFIAHSADIIGEVILGDDVSVWFNTTIRGDIASITIGDGSNVQDNCLIHVDRNIPTVVGKGVTVGHGVILHACTIEDDVLIGMGAIVLDESVIGKESLVAAGSLVPPKKVFPPRSLIMGSPARVVRSLSDDDIKKIKQNGKNYVSYGHTYNLEVGKEI
jgi:carbonic anhydrase/acetyltransferase-like protein (isoleucine patch superfamily)